jgi:hypothetical protein
MKMVIIQTPGSLLHDRIYRHFHVGPNVVGARAIFQGMYKGGSRLAVLEAWQHTPELLNTERAGIFH